MDKVAEFLTRIRNAGLAKHEKVDVPSSNIRVEIAEVLQKNGYIRGFRVEKDHRQNVMRVYLRYGADGEPMIRNVERVSTPSLRRYVGANEIPKVRNGYGVAVLSTNKGILTGEEASQNKLGGEFLFQIW